MRALWLVRDNLMQQPGGDTTQIIRTAEALRVLGVTVDIDSGRRPSFTGYDIVHLFHLDRLWENAPHCRRLRRAGVPSVLSTIYWPADRFDRAGRIGLQGVLARTVGSDCYRSLRLVQRWAMSLPGSLRAGVFDRPTLSFLRCARFCLETVSAILPNSRAEQKVIEAGLGVSRPTVVVPNAVSAEYLADPPSPNAHRQGVICVGRIEPRKNQLALIRAMNGFDIILTLIGQPGRYSRAYHARCLAEAGPNVRFVGHSVPAELRDWYSRSLVHVCPSWYETPGLVNLEAAVRGCAVVATPGGSTREYLGDDAFYCEPDDITSIRQAIETALAEGSRDALSKRVAREFTWEAAARKTLDAYHLVLG